MARIYCGEFAKLRTLAAKCSRHLNEYASKSLLYNKLRIRREVFLSSKDCKALQSILARLCR